MSNMNWKFAKDVDAIDEAQKYFDKVDLKIKLIGHKVLDDTHVFEVSFQDFAALLKHEMVKILVEFEREGEETVEAIQVLGAKGWLYLTGVKS